MISGRALAHTGGTLDKLEAIPGFRTNLSLDEFRHVLADCGLSLIGQTREIAPADRKIYALRDLTATVPFRPFMCASIMSKKLAEGIDGLVLDVKTGNGAFMREEADARLLAEMMTRVGRRMGKRVIALITDMSQPLGRKVGNAIETAEAISLLRGDADGDFARLCLELSARMLLVGGVESDVDVARRRARNAVLSGEALDRFRRVIELQGGDPRVCDDPGLLPQARFQTTIVADRPGIIGHIQTDEIGRIVMDWGGGRRRLEDTIDYGVGIEVHVRLGEAVAAGAPLFTAWYNDSGPLDSMRQRIRAACLIADSAPPPPPLIRAEIGEPRAD